MVGVISMCMNAQELCDYNSLLLRLSHIHTDNQYMQIVCYKT